MTSHRLSVVVGGALALAALFAASRASARRSPSTVASVTADRSLAFVGATVIPMTGPRLRDSRDPVVLPRQTVLIRSGRIVAVGPVDSTLVPADAIRIDSRSYFITPGLVDAHVHSLRRESSADLPLYLANGITTVRNMYGEPYHVRWRQEIATGARLGPRLVTTSAFADGLTTPEQARIFVRQARLDGYDAVKVHLPLQPSVYEAITAAARVEKIPVVGHAPGRGLGVAAAVRAGQRTIEHAESIMQVETNEQDPADADIPRIVSQLRGSGICVTPTLVTFDHVIRMTEQYPKLHGLLSQPTMQYVRPDLRSEWAPTHNEYVMRWRGHEAELPNALAKFRRQYSWMRRLVGALAAADVPILAGTDASVATVIPGFSLHEELRLLVEAGLSPYGALRAASADAAFCFGRPGEFGAVQTGMSADLLLLNQNPLVDIAAVAHPVGVVVAGRWLPSDTLSRMLAR